MCIDIAGQCIDSTRSPVSVSAESRTQAAHKSGLITADVHAQG